MKCLATCMKKLYINYIIVTSPLYYGYISPVPPRVSLSALWTTFYKLSPWYCKYQPLFVLIIFLSGCWWYFHCGSDQMSRLCLISCATFSLISITSGTRMHLICARNLYWSLCKKWLLVFLCVRVWMIHRAATMCCFSEFLVGL